MNNILADTGVERAVLAGICKYGDKVYYDVASILSSESFTLDSNKIIYRCLEHIFEQNPSTAIDIPSIYSASTAIGLRYFFQKTEETKYLHAILQFPVARENVRQFGLKLYRLHIAREMHKQLGVAQEQLLSIDGTQNTTEILGVVEKSIFDLSILGNEGSDDAIKLGSLVGEYLEDKRKNPVEQVGIPTGFSNYDKAIGGGLRPGTLNVIGARPKMGKSMLAINIAYNIAKNNNIPVLYVDTEMTEDIQLPRLISRMSNVGLNKLETGQFSNSKVDEKKLDDIKNISEDLPLYYIKVVEHPFEDQLAMMRRWLFKHVLSQKERVIIYDFFQVSSGDNLSSSVQEYQLLGFMMKSLKSFATKYNLPIITMIQLNRDGITKETTDIVSGSDRIIWLCSNFSILKTKSDEEIGLDGPGKGNRKLVPLITRHGEGLDDRDYINLDMNKSTMTIYETRTKFQHEFEMKENGDKIQL